MSIFALFGNRSRAEQTALAHERLRALVSSAVQPSGWVPPPEGESAGEPPDVVRAGAPLSPDLASDLLARARLSPVAVTGLAVVLLVAVLIAGLLAWHGRARDVGAGLAPPQPPPAVAASAAAPGSRVVVDVAGRVRRPGLVTLPAGSRVADAIRAAGGARPGTDLTSLNLARKLVDGEQILVGVPGAAVASAGSPGPMAPLNLNTATASELDQLPGVGPVLAQRIVDWRVAHGGFTSVSQLRQVTGIGDSKYADLQPLVRI